jgi:hypothetical protein
LRLTPLARAAALRRRRSLVQLPKTACLNPSPSFYRQFNGYTLGLMGALLAGGALYALGTRVVARVTLRNLPEAERAERLGRFGSTVLARVLLLLYVAYPGVSVAVFSMFSCTLLPSSDRSFLDADLSIRCYDALHWRYIAAAVAWLFVVPVGVPCFFVWLMRHFRVPHIARLCADNAWLREAVELAWTCGMAQPDVNIAALDVDNVADAHLEALHAFLLHDATAAEAANILAGLAATSPPTPTDAKGDAAAVEGDAVHAAAHHHHHHEHALARLLSTARAAAARAASRRPFRGGVTPDGDGDSGGPDGVAAAAAAAAAERRTLVLRELLDWCSTSGKLALPVLCWDDLPSTAAADEAPTTADSEEPAPVAATTPGAAGDDDDDGATIRCADLPRLQSRALREVGFLFAAYRVDCWCGDHRVRRCPRRTTKTRSFIIASLANVLRHPARAHATATACGDALTPHASPLATAGTGRRLSSSASWRSPPSSRSFPPAPRARVRAWRLPANHSCLLGDRARPDARMPAHAFNHARSRGRLLARFRDAVGQSPHSPVCGRRPKLREHHLATQPLRLPLRRAAAQGASLGTRAGRKPPLLTPTCGCFVACRRGARTHAHR